MGKTWAVRIQGATAFCRVGIQLPWPKRLCLTPPGAADVERSHVLGVFSPSRKQNEGIQRVGAQVTRGDQYLVVNIQLSSQVPGSFCDHPIRSCANPDYGNCRFLHWND